MWSKAYLSYHASGRAKSAGSDLTAVAVPELFSRAECRAQEAEMPPPDRQPPAAAHKQASQPSAPAHTAAQAGHQAEAPPSTAHHEVHQKRLASDHWDIPRAKDEQQQSDVSLPAAKRQRAPEADSQAASQLLRAGEPAGEQEAASSAGSAQQSTHQQAVKEPERHQDQASAASPQLSSEQPSRAAEQAQPLPEPQVAVSAADDAQKHADMALPKDKQHLAGILQVRRTRATCRLPSCVGFVQLLLLASLNETLLWHELQHSQRFCSPRIVRSLLSLLWCQQI